MILRIIYCSLIDLIIEKLRKKFWATISKTTEFYGFCKNHEGEWFCIWLPRNHKQQVFCNTSSNTFLEMKPYLRFAQNWLLNDLNLTVYGHPWHHERLWSYIWLPRNRELEFFSKFQHKYFLPPKYVRSTYFTLFQVKFEILYGQVYGCQVFLVTIFGLDMVARIYLWWSTRGSHQSLNSKNEG